MSIINEIVAIEAQIKTLFPSAKTGKQTMPEKPVADSFYVRFEDDERETEARFYTKATRAYQIVYFAAKPEETIAKMDALGTALYQTEVVSPGIRVDSFEFAQPFKYENGEVHAIVGTLTVTVREPRQQAEYPIVQQIHIRQEVNG